ncbi:MAG: vWA domain-containing protein [Chloroflexota bacterium]
MSDLDARVEFAQNPDPRCACVLLLDTSSSMHGPPIDALNEGLRAFQQDLQADGLASRRVEIAVVSFGGTIQVLQEFVTAGRFNAPSLEARGDTPMGAAVQRALDLVQQRKAEYKANGIAYYRPWVFMITDGAPTDEWRGAADRVHQEEKANAIAFFAVGVAGASLEMLGELAERKPLPLDGLKFRELFLWLSQSQKRVSASKPGEQASLPPVGWSAV